MSSTIRVKLSNGKIQTLRPLPGCSTFYKTRVLHHVILEDGRQVRVVRRNPKRTYFNIDRVITFFGS